MVCINWAAENSKPRERMVQAASFSALKKIIEGATFIEMNDQNQKKADFVLQKVCTKSAEAKVFEKKRYHINKCTREYESSGDEED